MTRSKRKTNRRSNLRKVRKNTMKRRNTIRKVSKRKVYKNKTMKRRNIRRGILRVGGAWQQVEDSTLPEGWKAMVMSGKLGGRKYYYHVDNRQATQWDRPLPEGWEAVVSQSSGDTYYKNTATGETTWDLPTAAAPTPSPGGVNPTENAREQEAPKYVDLDHEESDKEQLIERMASYRANMVELQSQKPKLETELSKLETHLSNLSNSIIDPLGKLIKCAETEGVPQQLIQLATWSVRKDFQKKDKLKEYILQHKRGAIAQVDAEIDRMSNELKKTRDLLHPNQSRSTAPPSAVLTTSAITYSVGDTVKVENNYSPSGKLPLHKGDICTVLEVEEEELEGLAVVGGLLRVTHPRSRQSLWVPMRFVKPMARIN